MISSRSGSPAADAPQTLVVGMPCWSMIRPYGDDAEAQAAMRGDELLDRGDLDGSLLWHSIITAIRKLQAMAPTGDEGLH